MTGDRVALAAAVAIVLLAVGAFLVAWRAIGAADRMRLEVVAAARWAQDQTERAHTAEMDAARWRAVAGVHALGEGRAAGDAVITRMMPRVRHDPPVSQGGPLHIDPRFPAARSRSRHER